MVMPKGKRTTAAQAAEAKRLRSQGATYDRIATETGMHVRTVARLFADGVAVSPRDEPDYTPDSAKRLNVSMDAEQASALMARNPRLETTMVAGSITNGSLKMRLLRQICEGGPYDGVIPLMQAARRGPTDNYGAHEVTHILKDSLLKQNLVTFRVSRQGSTERLLDITATEAGRRAAGFARMNPLPLETMTSNRPAGWSRAKHAVGRDGTEERNHGSIAVGGPVDRIRPVHAEATGTVIQPTQDVPSQPEPEPVVPVAEPESWPHLEALRARLAAKIAAGQRAQGYLEAAVALAHVDPVRSEELMRLSEEAEGEPLTPEQQEYLRFAEASGK